MHLFNFLPFVAMAGVAVVFLLTRLYADGVPLTRPARHWILVVVAAIFVACCVAGAVTALQIVHIGLAATPPPTTFGAVARLVGVAVAIALWPMARHHIERAAIFTFVIGAGASGLIGLGVHSGILDAARAVYHLLMFACGAILAAGFAAGVATGATPPRRRNVTRTM